MCADTPDYKDTLNLPRTDFPMRAGLPKREPQWLDRWDRIGVYYRLRDKPGRPPFTPAQDAEWVRQVRDVCGPDFMLQADANTRWTVAEAVEFGRGVQDIDLRWLEEPCRSRRDMAAVRAATGLRICAGQSELTVEGARYLMTDKAIDICNYDPGYACGPTAWRKVYGLAQSFGLEMAVHQQPQVAGLLMAATPDGVKQAVG